MKRIILILSLSILFWTVLSSCGGNFGSSEQTHINKVLILGNSIVAHDPAPSIGWSGDWGMAASCRDSDFVHIIAKRIDEISPKTEVAWGNLSAFERDYATYDLTQLQKYQGADVLIVKISENVQYSPAMESKFKERYAALIEYLKGDNTTVVVSEGFWPTPINDWMKSCAQENGYLFVALSDLFADDKSNAAIGLFENEGVANHPSDKGMRNVAKRMLDVVVPKCFNK